jgi:hypothetical protein
MAARLLRHIRVASKNSEIASWLQLATSAKPVVHTWTYKLDKAA